MSILRERIASMIDSELHGYDSYGTALGIADAIMALPEIANALAVRRTPVRRKGCGNKPKPDATGNICMHSVSAPGEIWHCNLCGMSGGDL